jgi:predicted porin
MKKTLVTLAVLAASGAASAQVTVYGIADVWFGTTKAEVSGAATTPSSLSKTVLESGGVNSSRWGLKGSEDLGGGMKANFLLEQGFSIDTGAGGPGFNRYSNVGVSGGFGEVKLGKVGTAYDDIRGLNNNTFDSVLEAVPWVGYTGTGNNEIYYALPAMGGLSGALSYALGEDKTATADAGSVIALNVQYAAGPFMVGYAYQAETAGSVLPLGALAGINTTLATAGGSVATTPGDKATYNLLTGSYDLGVAKLLGSYNTAKFTVTGGELKADEFQIGADVPLSPAATLAVGYGQSKWKGNVDIAKATAYSAAINYSLSKRTSVYAGFNSTDVAFDSAIADATLKSTTYAVGLNHKF